MNVFILLLICYVVFSFVAISVISYFILKHMYSKSDLEPNKDLNGNYVLKDSKSALILNMSLLFAFVVIAYLMTNPISFLFIIFGTIIISLYSVFYVKNVQVILKEDKIIFQSVTKRVTELYWQDIKKLNFNYLSNKVTVIDWYENRVKVSYSMIGFKLFKRMLRSKVNHSEHKKFFNKLDYYYKFFFNS